MNIVHVNQHIIKHNAKHGTSYPALTVKLDAATKRALGVPASTIYCHEVEGSGRVIDSNAQGRKALSCGARVWMEFRPEGFRVLGTWTTFDALSELKAAA